MASEYAKKAQAVEDAFTALIEYDTKAAISLVTGIFVSLMTEYMRRHGHDPARDIYIDSGGKHDITIHAVKADAARGTAQAAESS